METVTLTPGRRVLFLTKDADLIRRQLAGELDLTMADLAVDDLLDDINTDVMTPAWVCFDWDPEEIAKNAYAGLIVDGERIFGPDALRNGNFEVIVSGVRKGVGSSRETAVQAEKWSGIRIAIAASFAPIHARNNVNQGVLMGDHALLKRLQAGEAVPLDDFTEGYDEVTTGIVRSGGLFPYLKRLDSAETEVPAPPARSARPLTMAERILSRHLVSGEGAVLEPGDSVLVRVDAGYSHEFTTAQVHHFLGEEFGPDYAV
ncbi:MAG: aconitate hydratase, partial [Planctomycetota bacterium]